MLKDYNSEMLQIIDWMVDGDFIRIKFIVLLLLDISLV